MLFEVAIFSFYTLFCLFSVLGYGIIFSKIIYNPSEKNIGELGIFGFLLLYFISLFFHFFIPLSYWFNFIILSLGFVISIAKFNYFKNEIVKIKTQFILITLIILPSILIYKTHGDYEWYHLPYVNYLNNFKIIFGLVNVVNHYAHGHGWMDIMGLFSLPVIETKGVSIIALIFFYFFLLYLIFEIKNTKLKSIKIYSIIAIIYCLATYNKLADFGAEIQPALMILVIILNVIKLLNNNNSNELLSKIILYFIFAIFLRIGSVVILPFVLIILLINFKHIPKSITTYLRLNFFLALFFIFFLLKNFILSGCLSYPLYKTCFDNDKVSWASPIENAQEHFEFLTAISHRWHFYVVEEANLQAREQYLEPMLKGIILDLRNNPGGLLKQSIILADSFLNSGEIVSVRSRSKTDTRTFMAEQGDQIDGLPLVVLINGGSASASEIVASALKFHNRATIMGSQSFGKGSVQTIIPLPDRGALRLTTALYYGPNGRTIQAKGIMPEVVIATEEENRKQDREVDLPGSLPAENVFKSGIVPTISKKACPDVEMGFEASIKRKTVDRVIGCAIAYVKMNSKDKFLAVYGRSKNM